MAVDRTPKSPPSSERAAWLPDRVVTPAESLKAEVVAVARRHTPSGLASRALALATRASRWGLPTVTATGLNRVTWGAFVTTTAKDAGSRALAVARSASSAATGSPASRARRTRSSATARTTALRAAAATGLAAAGVVADGFGAREPASAPTTGVMAPKEASNSRARGAVCGDMP